MNIQDTMLREDFDYIAALSISWEELKGKTLLVTGATGLVGSQIVRAVAYCNEKYDLHMKVLALIRDPQKAESLLGSSADNGGIIFLKGDVLQPASEYLPEKINVDFIVHAASITASKTMITQPVETITTALDGTRNMLELARNHRSSAFVYISSMEVYGSFAEGKYVSEVDMGYIDPLQIRSNYPLGKRMCENMCIAYGAEYGVPVRIARLSQTFGAGILPGENRVFAQFARSVLNKTDIVLHTKGLSEGNYCYTRDTVAAILFLLLRGENNSAYNISNEDCHTTIADMAKMVAHKLANDEIKVVFDIPETNQFGYANDTHMKLNASKLRNLGWIPTVGLEEAYRRMIRSMQETNV